MRFAIIFGRTHQDEVVVAVGPGSPDELNRQFKEFASEKQHEEFAELYLHELYLSQGRKRIAFASPQIADGDGLDELSIKKLHNLGNNEGVDLAGCKPKKEYIDRIRAFRSLNEKTVDDLKQLASEETIDIAGSKLKKDLINTITKHRRDAAIPPAE